MTGYEPATKLKVEYLLTNCMDIAPVARGTGIYEHEEALCKYIANQARKLIKTGEALASTGRSSSSRNWEIVQGGAAVSTQQDPIHGRYRSQRGKRRFGRRDAIAAEVHSVQRNMGPYSPSQLPLL